jgi:hypothetical protein
MSNECCDRRPYGTGIRNPDRHGVDRDGSQGRQDHDPREDDCLHEIPGCAGY